MKNSGFFKEMWLTIWRLFISLLRSGCFQNHARIQLELKTLFMSTNWRENEPFQLVFAKTSVLEPETSSLNPSTGLYCKEPCCLQLSLVVSSCLSLSLGVFWCPLVSLAVSSFLLLSIIVSTRLLRSLVFFCCLFLSLVSSDAQSWFS